MVKSILNFIFKCKYEIRVSQIAKRHSQDHAVGYTAAKQGTTLAKLIEDFNQAPVFMPINKIDILAGHAMYHLDVEQGYYGKN